MIKNLKSLRTNQPEPLAKIGLGAKQPFAKKKEVKQSSEDMDFDDWSQSNDMQAGNFKRTNVQKGFYQNKGQPQYPNIAQQHNNGYYSDDFEESDEMEALPFNAKGPGANQILQQQYNMGNATYRRLQHQQSPDMDFDDNDDFDDDVSNGQESDDFGDVQLNVRRFKSSAKKNFVKEKEKPVVVDEFTDESGFNFEEEDKPVPKPHIQTNNVSKQLNYNLPTDKKILNRDNNLNGIPGAQTNKLPTGGVLSKESHLKPPAPVQNKKNQPVSAEQFEDTFSDDFTQNVGSVDNTQLNQGPERPYVGQQKSEAETFKSDFDEYKDSFNVDISNFDNTPVIPNNNTKAYKQVQQPQVRVNSNDINAAIIHDRNVETKYLSSKLEENDTYTKKVKEFLEQKTVEYEKLKAKYELLVKDKVRLDDLNISHKQVLESQNVEIEQLVAENDAKQLAIDELTEKLNKGQDELKAKTKLLQERENLFGNSLNEKKIHINLNNLTKELEISKVRIEDYQEGIKRYEQRVIELEDELRCSPAALRTKALMQQRIEKLLKILHDNNIRADLGEIDHSDINEDMVYQEMILNGYIKDNKKLIDENKYLKDKLYNNKLNESKANFDNPIGRIKELEESVKRLQEELLKKDENFRKQAQRFDRADEIILEREKQIEALGKEKEEMVKLLKKEKALFKNHKKELASKIDELNVQVNAKENTNKPRENSKQAQAKSGDNSQPKLKRNIFSQDDQDFKHDIYSMLNNIKNDNKQVKSEIRLLKDTWELKGKLTEDIRVSDIPHPRSHNELNSTQINALRSPGADPDKLKQLIEELRTANRDLDEKVLILEQQILEKDRSVKKSEFLQKKWYDERQKLLEIIKNMPKSTRDIDFAVLEQKLINVEKDQKLKALELQTALKTFQHKDLSESTDTIHKGATDDWTNEKNKLIAIIKQKNGQIGKFKSQMETLIGEFKKLKAAQIN